MAMKSSARPHAGNPHPRSCAAGSGRGEKPTADSTAHRVRSSSGRQRGGRPGNRLRRRQIPGAPLRYRRSATVAASPRRSAATDPARCLAVRRTLPSPPQSAGLAAVPRARVRSGTDSDPEVKGTEGINRC